MTGAKTAEQQRQVSVISIAANLAVGLAAAYAGVLVGRSLS